MNHVIIIDKFNLCWCYANKWILQRLRAAHIGEYLLLVIYESNKNLQFNFFQRYHTFLDIFYQFNRKT